MLDVCDNSIDTLNSIVESKNMIKNKMKNGFAMVASYFQSSENSESNNSSVTDDKNVSHQLDSIDKVISDLSNKASNIKKSSENLTLNLKRDKELFGKLYSYNNIIEIIDSSE